MQMDFVLNIQVLHKYAMTLNATSNASCSMFEFEQGQGRTAEYVFKLN